MRKVEFAVPTEVMCEFADRLAEEGLANKITGTNEDDEILIEVSYERHEADTIDGLEEHLDELIESLTEDDLEEEEEYKPTIEHLVKSGRFFCRFFCHKK